ncbi:bifunctional 2',3'-cyclic-nucleotide 2'-phosphodiesterase/3'-nucleotidase [Seohaeicola saemankumensis]|uniref:Bifunctional 2',3'-cyclic-nucleotide 2'-phosphodiesterase/3'-nucleotidase n=1 Tax=Seohaeicola saemankumensis TaxID=481181 RepID=A0ABW3TDJ4_9RHOB
MLEEIDLRLLQTTDLHAHLLAYDYLSDQPADRMGLARLASLIHAARAEAKNCLLLDTGDFLQGSPLGDLYADPQMTDHDRTHPVIATMNSLGYDPATLGNHDFNYGIDFLGRTLLRAAFPLVCANVAHRLGPDPSADDTWLPPWTILTRRVRDRTGGWHDLRIGMIGLLPPQIGIWDRQHLEGRLQTRDMIQAARAHLPDMRAAGADLVVVLCHSGIAPDDGSARMENAALPLAALAGVDAILCGHQHRTFPGPAFSGIAGVDEKAGTIHGKPAVMAGFWGSHLGLIDLTLRRTPDGWQVSGHRSALRPIFCRADDRTGRALVEDDSSVVALTRDAHARTLAHVRRPIGHSSQPLHSFFAMVADDPSIQLVAEAQRARVAALLAGTAEGELPLLSAVAPFKAGGTAGPEHFTHVPAGPLKIRNLADLYAFPNLLHAVQVTGDALCNWLEHAAGQFNTIRPGQRDQMLCNPDFPSYNFDVICGLRYVIDPTQPRRFGPDGTLLDRGARRIREITWNGRAIAADDRFIVATNSYRAGGGGGFDLSVEMRDVALDRPAPGYTESIQEVLEAHVAGNIITHVTRPVWRFAPLRDTSALFDSAPAAAEALHDLSGVRIESAGWAPDGFARFRLHF